MHALKRFFTGVFWSNEIFRLKKLECIHDLIEIRKTHLTWCIYVSLDLRVSPQYWPFQLYYTKILNWKFLSIDKNYLQTLIVFWWAEFIWFPMYLIKTILQQTLHLTFRTFLSAFRWPTYNSIIYSFHSSWSVN